MDHTRGFVHAGSGHESVDRVPRKLSVAVALMLALDASRVFADVPDPPVLKLSGFGTLGVVHSSENDADYVTSIFKPDGAGRSRSWSPAVDSVLGVQAVAHLTPQASAVVQLVSEQNYDGSYRPHVEWANLKYDITPDAFVRVGRVVMPSFLVSGFRKVGYASPWVRPPPGVYGIVPISTNDGVDASYRMHFGETSSTLQGTYGSLKSRAVDGTFSTARNQWGIFSTTDYGALTLRVAYHQAHLTLRSLDSFFAALRGFGPEGVALAQKYQCDGKLVPFASTGASYDPGKWFVTGEWATSRSHCFIGARSGWYAGGGYRLGKVTPYATYARSMAESERSTPGLTVSALPPFLQGPAAGVNAALNGIIGSVPRQQTIVIGARWDFAKHAAVKVQLDHIRLGAGSKGTLTNTSPAFQPGGKLNVFSATLDFVF
jgi:hypothetical protein